MRSFICIALVMSGCGARDPSCSGGCVDQAVGRDSASIPDEAALADLGTDDSFTADDAADAAQPKWVAQNSGTNAPALSGVWGSGPNDVFVNGADPPIVLHSKNGGQTWDMLSTGGAVEPTPVTGNGLGDVYFGEAQSNISAALHSRNGGMTWVNEPLSQNFQGVYTVAVRGTDAYVTGSNGQSNGIMHSSTKQPSWAPIGNVNAACYGLALFDSGRMFAACETGQIFYSADSGQSWTSQVTNTIEIRHAIWGADPSELWSVGENGSMVHTTDGGTTWKVQNSGVPSVIYSVWGSSADDVYAVGGQPHVILHTVDHGQTWLQEPAPVNPDVSLFQVWGSGPNDIYVVGDEGTILHKQ